MTKNDKPWTDISKSFFISANAGSGKTTVLIERILSLLFADINPSSILCITYTNAGVKEMKERILKELTKLSKMKDNDLIEHLNEKLQTQNTLNHIPNIRLVLQKALSPEGQVEIYTFHAFWLKIISLFKQESNLESNFEILETNYFLKKQVFEKIKTNLFLESLKDKSMQFMQISGIINSLIYFYKTTFFFKIEEMIENKIILKNINYDETKKAIQLCYNNPNPENIEDINKYFYYKLKQDVDLDLPCKIVSEYNGIENFFKSSVEKFVEDSEDFKNNGNYKKLYESALKMYLKYNDEIKTKFVNKNHNVPSNLITKLNENAMKVFDLHALKTSCLYAKSIQMFLDLWRFLDSQYQKIKKDMNFIDFDDIIIKTQNLLQDNEKNIWINYKLGTKIQHILVDEAQDTNELQWNIIIEGLFEDLVHGKGAGDNKTIFIVGDEKQMIYSFQGSQFMMLNRIYEKISKTYPIEKVSKQINYRSSEDILTFVDSVFEHEKIKSIYNMDVKHIANKKQQPCVIEVFEPSKTFLDAQQQEEKQDTKNNDLQNKTIDKKFFEPEEEKLQNDILAKQVCYKVLHILGRSNVVSSQDMQENIYHSNVDKMLQDNNIINTSKDITILTKSRDGNLFEKLFTEFEKYNLKLEDISYRKISDLSCIMEVMSFIRILILKHDESSIVSVLQSPIFNISWQEITDKILQYKKGSNTLNSQEILDYFFSNYPNFETIYKELIHNLLTLDIENFVNYVFIKLGQFYKNYQQKELKYIFEILNQYKTSVKFYNAKYENIFGFVEYFFNNLDFKISNSSNNHTSDNSILISTIHSAKGMENKIIILLDASKEDSKSKKTLFVDDNGVLTMELSKKEMIVKGSFPQNFQKHKEKEQIEDFNLLYVALTRAKEQLYIFSKNNSGWYPILQESINKLYNSNFIAKNLNIKPDKKENDLKNTDNTIQILDILNNIDIANNNVTKIQSFTSNIKDQEIILENESEDDSSWLKKSKLDYGNAMHKMLEMVNFIDSPLQAYQFLSYLKYSENKDEIINNFLEIKNKFHNLFRHENAVFEANISCYNQSLNLIQYGRVDFMIKDTKNNLITIIDFKTTKNTNSTTNTNQYIEQLNFYKQILQQNNPSITNIKSYILWTDTQTLQEIQ